MGDLDYYIPLGKAKLVRGRRVDDPHLSGDGPPGDVEAVKTLGISADVIDLRSLDRAGIDWETIEAIDRQDRQCADRRAGLDRHLLRRLLADAIQSRCFDMLDQPVRRVRGGEASPQSSRCSSRPAAGLEEVQAGCRHMMAERDGRSDG